MGPLVTAPRVRARNIIMCACAPLALALSLSLGTMWGSGIFWREVAMHPIILLIVFVALAAIIIWVADWTSSPRSS